MLRFFRHIRKKLMEQNKIRTYILYAFGEIALVMIGILLALQVNNWNEERKMANEEQAILSQLLEDLKLAKVQSEISIKRDQQELANIKMILSNEELKNEILVNTQIDTLFWDTFWNLSSEIPVIISYEDLQNAGNTGLISSFQLREKLAILEIMLQSFTAVMDDRISVHQFRIDSIIEDEINFLPLLKAVRDIPTIDEGNSNDYYSLMQRQNIRNLMGVKLDFGYTVLEKRLQINAQMVDIIELAISEMEQ